MNISDYTTSSYTMSSLLRPADISYGGLLANSVYLTAMISGLAIGYAKITKLIIKARNNQADGYDFGMVILDFEFAVYTTDMLINYGILPVVIVK